MEKENNAPDRMRESEKFTRLQAHSALYLRAINLYVYQTGMRLRKILELTWNRIDFQSGLIQLRTEDT